MNIKRSCSRKTTPTILYHYFYNLLFHPFQSVSSEHSRDITGCFPRWGRADKLIIQSKLNTKHKYAFNTGLHDFIDNEISKIRL